MVVDDGCERSCFIALPVLHSHCSPLRFCPPDSSVVGVCGRSVSFLLRAHFMSLTVTVDSGILLRPTNSSIPPSSSNTIRTKGLEHQAS